MHLKDLTYIASLNLKKQKTKMFLALPTSEIGPTWTEHCSLTNDILGVLKEKRKKLRHISIFYIYIYILYVLANEFLIKDHTSLKDFCFRDVLHQEFHCVLSCQQQPPVSGPQNIWWHWLWYLDHSPCSLWWYLWVSASVSQGWGTMLSEKKSPCPSSYALSVVHQVEFVDKLKYKPHDTSFSITCPYNCHCLKTLFLL